MKYIIICFFGTVILLFTNCTINKDLTGLYKNGNAELRFTNHPNTFESYFVGEMGYRDYSAGTWHINNRKLILFGFKNENIKTLDVESNITNNLEKNKDQIIIQYRNKGTFIKTILVVNNHQVIRILSDTVFFTEERIQTLQVKSYLSFTGFLPSFYPTIDTLSSQIIKVEFNKESGEIIALKFATKYEDFIRIKLTDTLFVKQNNKLISRTKGKFKKK